MAEVSYNLIVKTYLKLRSIKATARELEISEAKVKKTLITEGLYSNETSEYIEFLARQGKAPAEIAMIMHCGKSLVNMYLPYSKGAYNGDNPTVNALRVRNCRLKKKPG